MGKRHNIGIVKPPYKCFLSELFTHNKSCSFCHFLQQPPQKCSGRVFLFFPGFESGASALGLVL
nr:MAG TPA: hypothetical protein [Caudoviricetes sp.]